AVRMPEFSGSGVDRGLARLRLKLGEVEPQLVARSPEPGTALMRRLVVSAASSGQIRAGDPDGATYMILALRSAFITSRTLGNDFGVGLPSVAVLRAFCGGAGGSPVDDAWIESVGARLHLPERITLDRPTHPKPKRTPRPKRPP